MSVEGVVAQILLSVQRSSRTQPMCQGAPQAHWADSTRSSFVVLHHCRKKGKSQRHIPLE